MYVDPFEQIGMAERNAEQHRRSANEKEVRTFCGLRAIGFAHPLYFIHLILFPILQLVYYCVRSRRLILIWDEEREVPYNNIWRDGTK